MAEKSEPGAFDLLVSPEWFIQPSDNELESFPEDMEEIIDQLMSQIEIPVPPLPAIESPAVPEPVPSHIGQFVKANDDELQRLMNNTNKNTQKSTNTWVRRFDGWRKKGSRYRSYNFMNQMPISKHYFPLIEHTTYLLPIQTCLTTT